MLLRSLISASLLGCTSLALCPALVTPAHAQNPVLANAAYYYTGPATINTDLGNNDVVIGRSPGNPPNLTNDVNLGTTAQTAYAVTVVNGAQLNFSSQNPYTGVEVFNRNTLNIQGGIFGFGVSSHDNSVVNVSGGQGGYPSVNFSPNSFRISGDGNSTVNFNGATYCNRIDVQGSATLNVNGVNSNGTRLEVAYGLGSSTVNINTNSDTQTVLVGQNSSLNYNAGKSGSVYIGSTGANKIFGGTIGSIVAQSGVVDVFGGSISGLLTGEAGSGTSYNSTANIRGGSLSSLLNGDFSTVNIYGGNIGDVNTFENAVTNIYGGTIAPNTLLARDSGVVNLYGTGFALSSVIGTGSDGFGNYNSYNLTGTLQDGTPLSTTFRDYAGGNQIGGASSPLRFNAIVAAPEPGSAALLGIGFAGISGVIARRKRKA